MAKTNLGKERVYFILQSQVSSSLGKVRAGTKVVWKLRLTHSCALTCSLAQAQVVFLLPRAVCVRDGAALSGLGPPASVFSQDSLPQTQPMAIRLKQFSTEVPHPRGL